MSEQRINHAATARDHNHEAMRRRGFWASFRWQRSAQVHATLAQVEATLALVEQQRVANLIELFSEHISADILSVDDWEALTNEIKKGLGL